MPPAASKEKQIGLVVMTCCEDCDFQSQSIVTNDILQCDTADVWLKYIILTVTITSCDTNRQYNWMWLGHVNSGRIK